MGLGQESDIEGEVVSWEAALSAPGRVAMNCQKVVFAAIAPNFGRQGLHIMTASIRLVHEGCGSGHFTVDGAGDDLRKALAIGSDGVHRGQSRALSVASRAVVSLKTQDKCGLGQLRPAMDGTGPGERQRRRQGERGGVLESREQRCGALLPGEAQVLLQLVQRVCRAEKDLAILAAQAVQRAEH